MRSFKRIILMPLRWAIFPVLYMALVLGVFLVAVACRMVRKPIDVANEAALEFPDVVVIHDMTADKVTEFTQWCSDNDITLRNDAGFTLKHADTMRRYDDLRIEVDNLISGMSHILPVWMLPTPIPCLSLAFVLDRDMQSTQLMFFKMRWE